MRINICMALLQHLFLVENLVSTVMCRQAGWVLTLRSRSASKMVKSRPIYVLLVRPPEIRVL